MFFLVIIDELRIFFRKEVFEESLIFPSDTIPAIDLSTHSSSYNNVLIRVKS